MAIEAIHDLAPVPEGFRPRPAFRPLTRSSLLSQGFCVFSPLDLGCSLLGYLCASPSLLRQLARMSIPLEVLSGHLHGIPSFSPFPPSYVLTCCYFVVCQSPSYRHTHTPMVGICWMNWREGVFSQSSLFWWLDSDSLRWCWNVCCFVRNVQRTTCKEVHLKIRLTNLSLWNGNMLMIL